MKKKLITAFLLFITHFNFAQIVMSAKGITPDNVCSNDVQFLMERRAKPIESIEAIEKRLNETLSFSKDNISFEGNAKIQLAVNCKGEIGGGFHVVISSGNDELDNQLIEFFKSVREWQPGKKNKKKAVDSWYMWRVKILNGKISLDN